MYPRANEVLEFWFGPAGSPAPVARWFEKNPAFDAEIRARFGDDFERAARGELDDWAISPEKEPRSALALVILLDQFSRNLFRDSPRAFDQDASALAISRSVRKSAGYAALAPLERYVLLLPTMHAEDLDVQREGVAAYAQLRDDAIASGAPKEVVGMLKMAHEFAEKHEAIVARFGRFPHRNGVLGRTPTPDESEFLLGPGSSF